jgi:oligoendopeptidase F
MQKNTGIKTEWDLSLMYSSDTDPKIEKDVKAIESACAAFDKKYRGKDFTKSEKTLLAALKDYEALYKKTSGAKPLVYFHYRQALNTSDSSVAARIQQLDERLTKAGNKIIFFDVVLSKTKPQLQSKYLKSKSLSFYRHILKQTFESGKHTLTEPEEKILSLTSQTTGAWVDGVERALNKRMVSYKGKKLPINEAIPKLPTLTEKKDRDALWAGIAAELKSLHDFTEAEINAFYNSKKTTDELRGFKKPYNATLLGHEVDEKTMWAVVNAVNSRMDIPRRFFALKKKLQKLDAMHLSDINAPLTGHHKHLSFTESHEMVRKAYDKIDPEFVKIYDDAFAQGRVDVFSRQGKTGGGFHSKTVGTPGVILLNHVEDLRSAFTLAHEMGHLIHSTLSERLQNPIYQSYSTAAAEVASTFGEQVLFSHIKPELKPEEMLGALHENLLENITAVFRVIADFNCEHNMYAEIYKRGFVPMSEITNMYVESRKSFVGNSVELAPDDGYRVVYTSHFRLKYYWYTYAFGCLIARALFARVQKDPKYVSKVKEFLSAGGSANPADIFKGIGVDITKPKFWQEGIDAIENDLEEFEKLVKNSSK